MVQQLRNITSLLLIICSFVVNAQDERKFIREGNKMFEAENYFAADTFYLQALQADSNSIEAKYNLANSQLAQGRNDMAIKGYQEFVNNIADKSLKAKTYHNLGNAHANKQEWEKAVEAYKSALRLNPNDKETRYNYSFAKSKIPKKDPNQKNDNKDQKKDEKKNEEEKKKEQDQKDEKKDQGNEDQKNDKNQDGKGDSEEKKEGGKDKNEKENKDKDQKDEADQKNNDQSDEGKNGDSQKNPENKDGKPSKPSKEQQKEAKAQALKKQQAEQILKQLDKNEKKIQQRFIRQKMKQQPRKKIDKDW